MDGFYIDFLTPDVWNGLVLAVVLIGGSLAVLRIIEDRKAHQRKQTRRAQRQRALDHQESSTSPGLSTQPENDRSPQ